MFGVQIKVSNIQQPLFIESAIQPDGGLSRTKNFKIYFSFTGNKLS